VTTARQVTFMIALFQIFDQLTSIKDKLAEEPVSDIPTVNYDARYQDIRIMFGFLLSGTLGIYLNIYI
jgi:hypothetical protein